MFSDPGVSGDRFGRKVGLVFVDCGVGEVGGGESLAALGAGAAAAAVALAAFVAGVGVGVVDAEGGAAAGDVGFGDTGVWGVDGYVVVGSAGDCTGHCFDEFGATVGVNGVVTAVVCHHHVCKAAAFCKAGGDGQHYAVAEWHDG